VGPNTGEPDPVDEAIERVLAGRAVALHVSGARGSGRTRWLDRVAEQASARGLSVVRTRGLAADLGPPMGVANSLTRSLLAVSGDDRHDGRPSRHAPAMLFEVATTIAASAPLAILVDDVDELDPESAESIGVLVRRIDADAILVASTGRSHAPWPSTVSRLPPLEPERLVDLLVEVALAPAVAREIASIAHGNPGLALALANGLSDDQRSGRAPLTLRPRPEGLLADELHRGLQSLGDRVTRALAVAASEPSGRTSVIRGALVALGEDPGALDAAEETGTIVINGPVTAFRDPWTALVAPHLVAPASRRAAHRALAAQWGGPDDAVARAWHLAAASDGTDDDGANALAAVAAALAAAGTLRSAIATGERASALAVDPDRRIDLTLDALEWALDAGDLDAARRLRAGLPATSRRADVGIATREVAALLVGPSEASDDATDDADARPGPVDGTRAATWRARSERRDGLWRALVTGDHVGALERLEGGDPLGGALGGALAWRHRGDLGRSRAILMATPYLADDRTVASSWIERQVIALATDLDSLQGRGADALTTLGARVAPAQRGEPAIARAAARARLQTEPDRSAADEPAAFTHDDTEGPLRAIRSGIADGVLLDQPDALRQARDLARRHALPIEAAEALMWLARADHRLLDPAARELHQAGIRGWDRRLRRSASRDPAPAVDAEVAALSPAERRVADAVASGMTNREAAAALFVSVKTVDFHLQQIYRKLTIRSRTELAVRMMNTTTPAPLPEPPGTINARRGARR
jgi:DNA-binding NarL/FixJ family response regulator